MEKIPLLRPQLDAREQNQFQEAIEAERLAIEFKIKQEEMLSIFDEVREYLDYESILESPYFSNLSNELQEELQSRIKIKAELKQKIFFEDFVKIWNENRKTALRFLIKAIRTKEENVSMSNDNNKDIKELVEARTAGKFTKLSYLLKYRFSKINKELSDIDEDILLQIKTYRQSNLPKVKTALNDINEIMENIKAVKHSKESIIARKSSEVANFFDVDSDDVNDFNAELEDIMQEEFGTKITLGIEEKYDNIGNIVEKDFITAYVNYSREFKNLYRMLNEGKIVETQYIKDIIERAMPALRKDPPTVVYFHGDFGTGKTALAIHIAKTRFEKDPIVIAGSKYLEPDAFTEEYKISKRDAKDFLNQMFKDLGKDFRVDDDTNLEKVMEASIFTKQELRENLAKNIYARKYKESLRSGESPTEEGLKKFIEENQGKFEGDIDTELDVLFSNQVQGRYVLGAMYKAMKEGKPLIIDEANAITPDVLIAFNDLMTKKVGDKIMVRSDEKEIEVKDGYCVMWTGNTGERYTKARFNDTDPATFSRIAPIKVNYLPQSTEIQNMDTLLERLNLEKLEDTVFDDNKEMIDYIKKSKELASGDQIFQVMLLKLLNKRRGVNLLVKKENKNSVFEDIYRLSMASRIIMDMFEKKTDRIPDLKKLESILGVSDKVNLAEKLQKANLTMRELMDNIIGGFQDDGQAMDIEFYVWQFIKKQDTNPEEQLILYAILQKVGFFKDKNWPNYQECQGNTKEAMSQFKKMMEFNPLDEKNGIEKYKKIQKNGEYISLLNTNGEYEYEYFSSLETQQLLFGYLPARTKSDYESIAQKQKEVFGDREKEVRKQGLSESLKEIEDLLSVDLFKTSGQAQEVLDAIAELNLADEDGNPIIISAEDFFEKAEKFSKIMLGVMIDAGMISAEEYEGTENMDINEKVQFIKNHLKNN